MTPIKSLAMVRRPLEKAGTGVNHDSVRTVSLVLHMFAMGRASHLCLGVRGGVSKRKTKSCTRKEGEKIGTQGSIRKRLCTSHLFLGFV